jgi:hypothetical protein
MLLNHSKVRISMAICKEGKRGKENVGKEKRGD